MKDNLVKCTYLKFDSCCFDIYIYIYIYHSKFKYRDFRHFFRKVFIVCLFNYSVMVCIGNQVLICVPSYISWISLLLRPFHLHLLTYLCYDHTTTWFTDMFCSSFVNWWMIIPPEQRRCWGVYWFHSVRPSVRPSVCPSVRPSRLPCPLCNIYSSGWIPSILATNDHYHERVCRTQWPLTLTYIFKVIRPWLRKSCPLCSVYSSGWILFIFGTNDHYH